MSLRVGGQKPLLGVPLDEVGAVLVGGQFVDVDAGTLRRTEIGQLAFTLHGTPVVIRGQNVAGVVRTRA